MPTIGAPAPDFTLPDQDGRPVSLRDRRGHWTVLYFYPRDDTPGCTVEACEFTAALPGLRELGAEVYGCSADGAAAHRRFIDKHALGVRLLTDADKAVMRAYGAWGRKVMYGKEVEGVIRSTVLIDPDGNVAHHWAKVKAAGHAGQVRERLAELTGASVPAAVGAERPVRRPAKKAAAGKAGKAGKTGKAGKAAKKPARRAVLKAQPRKKAVAAVSRSKAAARPRKKTAGARPRRAGSRAR